MCAWVRGCAINGAFYLQIIINIVASWRWLNEERVEIIWN